MRFLSLPHRRHRRHRHNHHQRQNEPSDDDDVSAEEITPITHCIAFVPGVQVSRGIRSNLADGQNDWQNEVRTEVAIVSREWLYHPSFVIMYIFLGGPYWLFNKSPRKTTLQNTAS